jgi:hypothetical protein
MALREFRDSRGTEWTAWDVPPHRAFPSARAGTERRTTVTPGFAPERRSGRERRRRVAHPHLQAGWVCFSSGETKRRLYPPPAGWDTASEAELESMCNRAEQGAQPPR